MIDKLFEEINKSIIGNRIKEGLIKERLCVNTNNLSLISLLLASLLDSKNKKTGLIINDLNTYDIISNELLGLNSNTFLLPAFKENKSDIAGFISENESQFKRSFDCLVSEKPGIYILDEKVLFYKTNEKKKTETITFKINKNIDLNKTIKKLNKWGLESVDFCVSQNTVSKRGGILDIAPPNTNTAYRIELFGKTIESIRVFNIDTQFSIKNIEFFNIKKPIKAVESSSENKIYKNKIDTLLYITSNSISTEKKSKKPINIFTELIKMEYISKDVIIKKIDTILNAKHQTYLFNPSSKIFYRQEDMVELDLSIYKGFISKELNIACIPSQSSSIYKKTKNNNGSKNVFHDKKPRFRWGDFLVHEDRGIGIYRGLELVGSPGNEKENVKIEYLNSGSIFIPIDKLNKIHKYQGMGDSEPKLTELGGVQWEKQKTATKKSTQKVVDGLIELYKSREIPRGFSYDTNGDLIKQLENTFPYNETPDQIRSINDIYSDMRKTKPMDRLLYGDVGYGKTEVAMRAAMCAINSGKMVFFLAPTTILSDQHYITSKNRLGPFGVNIELLSRFKTKKEQLKIIEKIHTNNVDLLIGTHRLFSDDVPVNNLGLLIVDEEHRFGVKHKNKIRHLKNHTDLLTLTATPIPRTLQQSLVGIRDTSKITTPPLNRLPIKTYVKRFDWGWVFKSIEKEVNRGGQVYFLHNTVSDLQQIQELIKKRFNNLKIEIGHGKMPTKKLEETILNFFGGNIDVFICTTIIESGLDVSNANTIIINNAHKFGLSQLYQIRGRVGRGDRLANCYLSIPKRIQLQENAFERLKALEHYSSLGSGYDIAMRDLEIRGAGNLFGYEQSGQISKIGFDLYNKILQSSIDEKRGTKKHKKFKTKINYNGPAYINSDYISNTQERLGYYQRLSSGEKTATVQKIEEELIDRFGKTPIATKNLLMVSKIQTLLSGVFVSGCKISGCDVEMVFNPKNQKIDGGHIIRSIDKTSMVLGFKYNTKPTKKDQFLLKTNIGDENVLNFVNSFVKLLLSELFK